ncbi:MAG TPA: hypothetical protein VKR79_02200 [Gaiellaceae bacterium]|nr:hypothetical protein [Gaiellaceae bacterium]
MSPERRNDGGPGVARRVVTLPPGAAVETWAGANQAKDEKLRVRSLHRRASAGGFHLRHSDYGWALMDTDRKLVGARTDLSLKEIESLLAGALKQ